MGFLDHSTNNIIIDAVLTDTGRKMLADNRGRFRIAFFSLADDEVDYSTIEKFGRAVGKEKIAKNTPVFEAQTQGSLAVKHRLLTLPDPTVVRLPSVALTAQNLSSNLLTFNTSTSTTSTVSIEQTIEGETRIPDGVSDTTFTLILSDRFLSVQGRTEISIESTTRMASYNITRSETNDKNGAIAQFTLVLQPGLDDTIFSIYGNADDKNKISSVVSVIGDQSGIRKDFSISIVRPSTSTS
jgi:hypothetical protein